MTTMTLTPAAELAEKLTLVADHLRKNPHLASVNLNARAIEGAIQLQIAARRHLGEVSGVQALLMWAKSFANPTITLKWHDEAERIVSVDVTAKLGAYGAVVWDTEGGDLYRWRTGGKYHRTPITLDQLTNYVATGTVELLGAR
jgi:hypothetical protein